VVRRMRIRMGAAVGAHRFCRDVEGAVPYDGFNGAFVGAAALGGPLGHRQYSGHFPGSKPSPYGERWRVRRERIHPFRGGLLRNA